MKRVVFARMPGDSRFRYSGQLPFSDGIPTSADVRFKQLQQQFWLSGNKGNIIIGESVGRLFEIDRSRSCYLNILDLFKAGWSAGQIASEFNEGFDYVVFAMANSIRPHMGAAHERIAAVIELLKTNLIVLGMGMQEPLTYNYQAVDAGTLRLLRKFNEKAKIFGVRGLDTEAWLHAMKIDRARALGCPSLYVYPKHTCRITAPDSFSAASSILTAGHLHIRSKRTQALLSLFQHSKVSYVMQDEVFQACLGKAFAPDQEFYNDVTGEFDKAAVNKVFEKRQRARLPFQGYWYFQSPDTWRAFCARHDLYIGDRFHGGVAAMQAGIPALIIWNDLRVRELTGFFGIPNIPIADLPGKSVDDLVAERLSKDNIETFQAVYRQRFEDFKQALEQAGLPLAVSIENPGSKSQAEGWWGRFSKRASS